MNLTVTSIFYLLVGCGVGVAIALRERHAMTVGMVGKPIAAIFFWPMFVPLLLEDSTGAATSRRRTTLDRSLLVANDALSQAIRQVEGELDAALASLDGWSDSVMSLEHERFDELRRAWNVQADRIRELDHLFNQPAFKQTVDVTGLDDRLAHSERVRQENIVRLKGIRDRLHHDLLGTIAWVRELVTMIHLAKYTGAPASRADELVRQIATAVEGLSEVNSWQDGTAKELEMAPQ